MGDTNPSPDHFEAAAVEIFQQTVIELFGEEARQEPIKYCTKETKNIQRVYVGTPLQFFEFFDKQGVKEALGIKSIDRSSNVIVVSTTDKKGNKGTQKFTLGTDPDAEQVLYRRNGYTSFTCLKSMEQF